jgi:hypothetical protein
MAPPDASRPAPTGVACDPRKSEHFGEWLGQENNPQPNPTQSLATGDDRPAGYLSAHAARFRPVIYGDPCIPDDALEGSAEAPKLLGKKARHSLQIATIQRAHAQKALAHRWDNLTPGDVRAALVEMKRAGLLFEAAYYAGEDDARPVLWREPTASNMLCRGVNAPFPALSHVPAAHRKAALEAADTPVKAAPLARERFGRIVNLTQAERVASKAWQIPPCDMTMADARRETKRRYEAERRASMSPAQREAELAKQRARMAAKRQVRREAKLAAIIVLWCLWLCRIQALCVDSHLEDTSLGLSTHTPAGGGA